MTCLHYVYVAPWQLGVQRPRRGGREARRRGAQEQLDAQEPQVRALPLPLAALAQVLAFFPSVSSHRHLPLASLLPCSPRSQSRPQQAEGGGRADHGRPAQDEHDDHLARVRRHTPFSLLSAATDTGNALSLTASRATSSMRRPPSTSLPVSRRTRPSPHSSAPPHALCPTVSSH